jgi:hypothetical protein
VVDVAGSGLSAACEKCGWIFIEEVAFLMGFLFLGFLHDIGLTALFF